MPKTLDLTKGYLPVVIVCGLLFLSFTVGTAWNSSEKDIQSLQEQVRELTREIASLRETVQQSKGLSGKDLMLYCFRLTQLNQGFKCPDSI